MNMRKKNIKSKKRNKVKNSQICLIAICIIIFLIVVVIICGDNKNNINYSYDKNSLNSNSMQETGMQLAKTWYINNIPKIEESFNDFLLNNGVRNMVTTKTDLKFDNDVGLYYIINYSGGILNGQRVSGHARCFVKYKETNIQWFSLEMTYDNNPWSPIVDWYNDEYDSIVEDYYYELQRMVN